MFRLSYIRCILQICMILLPVSIAAQNSSEAKSVLEHAVAVIEKSSGVEATFSIETMQGASLSSSAGTIQLKGDKFKIRIGENISWFDGKTQWSYQKRSDEVTVTTPTQRELESVNPYKLLNLYKYGYTYAMSKNKTYKGRSVYVVELATSDNRKDFSKIVIYVDKESYLPKYIELTLRNKATNKIVVINCKTNVNLSDATFVFNRKNYQSAEIIDLR